MKTVCFNKHVRGSSHIASDKVCQDYSGKRVVKGRRGRAYVAVVADGHGDPTCRRSDRGSRFAVEITLDCLEELARQYLDADDRTWYDLHESIVEASETEPLKRHLAASIVQGWREAVFADYAAEPIDELSQAMEEADEAWRQKALRRMYGTTLVCALALPDIYLFAQQGDGCVTGIFCDGRDSLSCGTIVPEDELCIGNVTTSLSDAAAAERMRIVALDAETDPLAAAFVGTDGVDKSLPRENGASDLFAGIALDVLDRCEQGVWDQEQVEKDLGEMLDRVSRSGSGDDASIAAIVDCKQLKRIAQRLEREREKFDLQTTVATDKARLSSMARKYEYYRTLNPPNDIIAQERAAYIEEYETLERRVRSMEADLGKREQEPEQQPEAEPEPEPKSRPKHLAPSETTEPEESTDQPEQDAPVASLPPANATSAANAAPAASGANPSASAGDPSSPAIAQSDDASFAQTPQLPRRRKGAAPPVRVNAAAKTSDRKRVRVLVALVVTLVVALLFMIFVFFGGASSAPNQAEVRVSTSEQTTESERSTNSTNNMMSDPRSESSQNYDVPSGEDNTDYGESSDSHNPPSFTHRTNVIPVPSEDQVPERPESWTVPDNV